MNSATLAKRSFFFLALASSAYGAVIFLYAAFLKIQYPYMVNLGEPALSQAIGLVGQFRLPYRDLSQPPYTLVPYGPVYLVLSAALGRLFQTPFIAGRIVTLASTFCAALLIYRILRNDGVRREFSLPAALSFVSIPYVYRWGTVVNVDMTGTCLDLAAFYFWRRYISADFRGRFFFIFGIFLSLSAFFTKSSMAAAPAAFFFYLLFRQKYKTAAFLFLSQAVAAGLIYFSLDQASHGAYFFHTVFEISRRRFFYQFIPRFWWGTLRDCPVLAAGSFFGLWAALRGKKNVFLGLYIFFATALTLSLGKQGSDSNYFLVWCAVSAVTLGTALETASRKTGTEYAASILLLAQLWFWNTPHSNLAAMKKGYQNSREFFDRISLFVEKAPGDVLSEDMSILVARGRRIFYEPFPMGQMSYSGVWDPAPILGALEARHFSLAILYFYAPALKKSRTFTLAFMQKFNENYRYMGRAQPPKDTADLAPNALYFYVPKKE